MLLRILDRLEEIIIVLIVLEIAFTVFEILTRH